MILNKLKAFFNPEQFQGTGKRKNYFEGWYYKIVDQPGNHALAIIPGIAMDENNKRQAFIQVLDGKQKTAQYHKFELGSFSSVPGIFKISIENNHFSEEALSLDLPGLKGSLSFSGNVPWPKPWYSPGIMGPYAFVPFMECYHGIVSMDHTINGGLKVGDERIDFDRGRGYIEKDWGRSFPAAYIWLQSNHFSSPGISVKVSVANIPWIRKSFTGFIAGLWLQDRLIRFTTYNRSVLRKSYVDSKEVIIEMENPEYFISVRVVRDAASVLSAPIRGAMEGKIEESMSSLVEVMLKEKKTQNIIFQDNGRNACLEVAGNIALIFSD